jgi:hypothetical protein
MPVLTDANIRAAFDRSNIPPSAYDYQGRVLEGILQQAGLPESAVLAVSLTEMSLRPDGISMGTAPMLLVVCPAGFAVGTEKGLFSKRVEVQSFAYQNTSAVLADEKMYAPTRGEMAIQGMVAGSVPRFRLGWNWSRGGPVRAEDAAGERNRMLDAMQRAMRGDIAAPAAEPATAPGSAAASLISWKQRLTDWTERLFREAEVGPVPENVDSITRMAAIGLFETCVVGFANARPLPSLQRYCRNLPGELRDRLDQFDEIYRTMIRLAAEEDAGTQDAADPSYVRIRQQHIALVNDAFAHCLTEAEDSYRAGIRADFG